MPWSPHVYRSVARERGISPQATNDLVECISNIQEKGLPPVLTLKHLAILTKTEYRYLRHIVQRTAKHPYRFFKIKKRQGGYRTICVPEKALLRTQRWLSRNILRKITPHPASYAYQKGQSALACATVHCGCKWLVKVDIQQFFECITEKQVFHIFDEMGYPKLLSFEMARLCTRTLEPKKDGEKQSRKQELARWTNRKADSYEIPVYRNSELGHLPQGAATSPLLSNLVVRSLDRKLMDVGKRRNIVFTRYSDDIVFSSGSNQFTRSDATSLIREVYSILKSEGFRPKRTKTTVAPPGARKVVLGLLVDGPKPRLHKKFKSRLRQHVYFLRRFGALRHMESRGFNSLYSMKAHINGLLTYAMHVEPAFAIPLVQDFESVEFPF